MNASHNNKTVASVCGLYCKACSIYIATAEDPQRLKKHAADFDLNEEDIKCFGCRSDKRAAFCIDCKFPECAAQHGAEFCGECPEFPCADFRKFQQECPHRVEIWQDMESIVEAGVDKWLEEAKVNYSCAQCGTINSPYDLKCRKCGHRPAHRFIKNHKGIIKKYLKKNHIL